MPDIGDRDRFGNPLVDPATGQPLASPPAAFTTAGAATDPTTVTLTIERPDGTLLVYGWPASGANGTLTRESAGRFYIDVTYDLAGNWEYRLEGTGAVVAAEEGRVKVSRSRVLP
jgi:hypothetical protein